MSISALSEGDLHLPVKMFKGPVQIGPPCRKLAIAILNDAAAVTWTGAAIVTGS